MAFSPRLGLSNLLVRRVMRHRSVATLFRPASTPVELQHGPTETVVAVPVRDGEPLSPSAWIVGEPMPAASPTPAEPRPTVSSTLPRPPLRDIPAAVLSPEVPERAPTPRPAEPTVARRAAVQAAVTAAEGPGDAAAGSDAPITDTVWHRLQTIFQRHQGKEAQPTGGSEAGTNVEAEASSQPLASSPREAIGRGSGNLAKGTAEAGISRVPQARAAETQDSPTEGPGRERSRAQAPGPPRPAKISEREGSRVEDAGGTPTVQYAPTAPSRVDTAAHPDVTAPEQARRPMGEATIDRSTQSELTAPGERRAPSPVVPQAARVDQRPPEPAGALDPMNMEILRPDEAPAPEAVPGREEAVPEAASAPDETPTQPLPLQQAWGVERTPQGLWPRPRRSSIAPAVEREVRGPAAAEPALLHEDTGPSAGRQVPGGIPVTTVAAREPVGRMLAQIASGRRTRSTIETLAPRGPRPAPAERPALRQVRRTAPPAAEATEPRSEGSELQPGADNPLIETPIGPLPADLWSLIGEPVPQNAEARGQTPGVQTASATQPQMAPAPRQTMVPAAPARGPAVIQRIVAEPPVEEESLPAQEETPAADATESAAEPPVDRGAEPQDREEASPAVDLDELARRVYDEVKHRLAMERERSQRRS